MPNVQVNMVDGSTRFTTSQKGSTAVMVAQVTGLTGDEAKRAADAVSAAMAAASTSLATDSGTLFLAEGTATFPTGATETANVVITYATPSVDTAAPAVPQQVGPEHAEVEIDTTLTGGTTDFDHNGARITAEYRKAPDEDPVSYPATADFLEANTTVQLNSLEVSSPGAKSLFYTGTINHDEVFYGSPKHTWLCTGISGRRLQTYPTPLWEVSYGFQCHYRVRPGQPTFLDTWDPWIIAKDPSTGAPFKDITFDPLADPIGNQNGLKSVQIYREEDWSALGLIVL